MGGGKERLKEYCGLVVKAWGWQSFDRQFEPNLHVFMVTPKWCGLGYRSQADARKH